MDNKEQAIEALRTGLRIYDTESVSVALQSLPDNVSVLLNGIKAAMTVAVEKLED